MNSQNFIKKKRFFIILVILLAFIFLTQLTASAASPTPSPTASPSSTKSKCEERWTDGQCYKPAKPNDPLCPEGLTIDQSEENLCPSGYNCCHQFAKKIELQLQVPLLEYTTATGIGDYIKNIYKAALYIIVPLVIVIIIFAGIRWIFAAGDPGQIKEAKKYITSAFIGLIIALLSYIILSIVGLGELKDPNVTYIQSIPLEDGSFETDDLTGLKSSSQECFFNTYGSSSSAVQANLVTINFAGKRVRVHKLAQAAFEAASQQITAAGLTAKDRTGTFCWRPNRNNPNKYSLHSFGIAIDIEWQNNGNCHPKGDDQKLFDQLKEKYKSNIGEICKHASEFHCTCSHDPRLTAAMINNGFRWGGAYRNTFDSMHFEWIGKCFSR